MLKFDQMKRQKLLAIDHSKKASIDNRIQDLIQLINSNRQYVTTSSCSGRCLLFTKCDNLKKKNCTWIFVSHDEVDSTFLMKCIKESTSNSIIADLTLKFEPFILHVQCETIDAAKTMLKSGINAGFRNSGITISGKDKVMTAIRSPLSLEIPVARKNKLLITAEYVECIVEEINEKFHENWKRISRFQNELRSHFEQPFLKIEKQRDASLRWSSNKEFKTTVDSEITIEHLEKICNESLFFRN